jgi:hypothetical protein
MLDFTYRVNRAVGDVDQQSEHNHDLHASSETISNI